MNSSSTAVAPNRCRFLHRLGGDGLSSVRPRRLGVVKAGAWLRSLAGSALGLFFASAVTLSAAVPELNASRRLFDSWKSPVPPRQLIGNIYYVGAIGVSSFLIVTPEGHFLLDTAFEETVPQIQRSIEQLGFKLTDIKFILGSHAHNDHTGGHAAMKRLTGAQIVSSAADARILETGGEDDFSPYPKVLMRYTPVKADRIVRDGESLTLGGVTMTAHLTPGHTRGATTWTMNVKDGDRTRPVAFFSSVSIVDGTNLVKNPPYAGIVEDLRSTFAKLKAMPCEIWFAPHGGQFAMAEKFARLDRGENKSPFIDAEGWNNLIATAERDFLRRLEREQAAAK
jgi:metallo-beta-lactamase class B